METMLTTLEGEPELSEMITDVYVADNNKVYYKSSPSEYTELGSVNEILGCEISQLSEIEEILDGDELEPSEYDYLYFHKNGKIYYKSPLGGYSDLNYNVSLSGLEGLEEILEGDELGKGFKFKAPKMKFKAPKMKFKAPKMKFKAPKMKFKAPKMKFKAPKMKFKAPKINTKGLSKGISGIGKGFSSAGKAYGKHLSNMGKGISSAGKAYGKHLSNMSKGISSAAKGLAKGLAPLAEGLMEQLMPQSEQPEQPEEEEQFQDEEIEDISSGGGEMIDEEIDELEGIHTDNSGKRFYYSELNGEYIELAGDELGFMQFLTSAAGMAAGGNKSGLLNMATGALDMVAPGAGTVANIGLNAAQKQKEKQKAKKAANTAKRKKLLQFYANKKVILPRLVHNISF